MAKLPGGEMTGNHTEHILCRPLVFNQCALNTYAFPLNSSKLVSAVSAMIYQPTWNQRDSLHVIETSDHSPPSMSGDQIPSLSCRKRRQMPGVCCRGGGGDV